MSTGTELAERFFTKNGRTYDRIANLSTLGLDIWWKRKIMAKIPPNPACIIDQACGTGILTLKIAQRYPACRVVGVELRDEYLQIAKQKAQNLKLGNVEFRLGRAEDIVLEQSVDCITSSYLAKYAELDILVGNAAAMLRPGGVLVMHELTYPTNAAFRALWHLNFLCMQGYFAWQFPEWDMQFQELPPLVRESNWLDGLTKNLKLNHFSKIAVEPLFIQSAALVTGVK